MVRWFQYNVRLPFTSCNRTIMVNPTIPLNLELADILDLYATATGGMKQKIADKLEAFVFRKVNVRVINYPASRVPIIVKVKKFLNIDLREARDFVYGDKTLTLSIDTAQALVQHLTDTELKVKFETV